MDLPTTILAVTQETPLDRTLRLSLPGGVSPHFVPGQFVVLSDPAAAAPVRRAYSISSAPGDADALEITVRDMGSFGHTLYDLPVGTPLVMRPPQGRFVLETEAADALVLVAGGSGVTPFRSFVRALRREPAPPTTTLFQSAQQAAELVFHDEFRDHARDAAWFRYRPSVTRAAPEDPWPGARGRIDAARLGGALRAPDTVRFYACGPAAFVKAMLATAAELGVPPERCRKEQWG